MEKRLPKGHAYVRIRNRGYSIHIDAAKIDDAFSERMMAYLTTELKKENEEEQKKEEQG